MRILLSLATAIVILAVALLLLLTPFWTHFALDASGATHPGCSNGVCDGSEGKDVIPNSDMTINALIFTGDFSFGGANSPDPHVGSRTPLFTADEQSHMRDVRVVLYGFLLLAVVSLVFLAASLVRAKRAAGRWRAVARGGIWLIVAMIVLGLFAFFAFDTAFLLFHEIFFPGGNFSFGPDSNLIRLYPEPFWEISSAALGTLAIVGSLIVWFLARRRATALEAAA